MRIDVSFVPVEHGAAAEPLTIADLAPAEVDHIEQLGMPADRDRAATARVAARLELARRLGVHPRRVPLAVAWPSGKPYVEGSSIGLSWSHSGSWVALALADEGSVGVDIEYRPIEVPTRALALLGLASMEEFVAREAVGKVTGQGLAGPWPAGVTVQPLSAPAGYLAAVAAPSGPLTIRCHDLECVQVLPDRSHNIGAKRIARLAFWAFPGSSSWGSSAVQWKRFPLEGRAADRRTPSVMSR
jgi:hypothetical protein